MIVYKVFYKNYDLKKGELMGALIERRKDLRGMSKVDSGLRWAKFTFSHLMKDKETIFVVPDELNLWSDTKVTVEKWMFTKEEFLEMVKVVEQEMKKKVR
jgi:hypothetical protein